MPVMKSLRSFRLASTSGHILEVEANAPIHVPDSVFTEALAQGMIETDEPIATGLEATAGPDAPEPAAQIPDDDDGETGTGHLEQAVLRLITRGDEGDFKLDGYPKLVAVRKELPLEADPITATDVVECFDRLQDDINLAE